MKLSNQIKSFLCKDIEIETIINILLYSIILVMPFIVVNVSFPRYMVGKQIYLYIVGLLLTLIVIYLRPKKFTREELVAFIFLLTIMIATIFSPVRDIALWGSPERGEGLIVFFIYIILFFLSHRYLIVNEKLLNITLITTSIMSLYSIAQYYGMDPIQRWMFGYISRPEAIGLIGNRNFLSSYICIFLFISMAIYIFRGNKIYLIFSNIFFVTLLCTLTRGGWLAFLFYSFVGGILILKRKECLKRALLIFITFTLRFIFLNITTNNKVISRTDKELIISEEGEFKNSAGSRVNILKMSSKAFLNKPFLGYGPDTLKIRLLEDYPEESLAHIEKYNEIVDKSHNEFLEYAVSNGIFNLLAYLILIGLIIYKLIGEINNDISQIMLLTLIGYLVQSFFNISVIMVAPLYWIFLGFSLQKIKS